MTENTATATRATATADGPRILPSALCPSGDYERDCYAIAAEALRQVGFASVERTPWEDAVTAQDGDERVTVAVLAVPEDAWELTLEDLEGLVCPEVAAQGAALCVCGAAFGEELPERLRFDVMSVCLSEERGRARVHHVRGVWRS